MKRLIIMLVLVASLVAGSWYLLNPPSETKTHNSEEGGNKTIDFRHMQFIYSSTNATYSFKIENAYITNDKLYIVVKTMERKI